MQVDEKYLGICVAKNNRKKFSVPFFFFKVKITELSEQSGLMYWQDWVEIEVKDEDDKAVSNKKYKVILSSGEIRKGTLDGQGKAKLKNISPGKVQMKLQAI